VAEALAVSKDYVDKPGYEVWLPAIRARATAKLNNTSEADSLFVSALKDADNTQLATVVADMRDAYGDKQAAVKLTEWAGKYRPKDPLVLLHLGALRAATKDIEGAIKAFEEARDLTDQADLKADAWTRIGTVYYTANKEINKAEQAYLAALKLKPDHTTAMNNLAYLYVDRLGQPDKAIFYSEKAIAIMPRNGLVLDTYGWAMAKLGRYEQAQAVLEDAARMTRGHSAIHYHLGWLHEKTGRLKDAVEHYRLAKELTSREDPIYQSISDALDRIKAAQEPGRGK
jgi:tetratricopeptide (TPR) repeat protein